MTALKKIFVHLTWKRCKNSLWQKEKKHFVPNQSINGLEQGIHDFGNDQLSKSTRALLDEYFTINHIAVDQQQRSR